MYSLEEEKVERRRQRKKETEIKKEREKKYIPTAEKNGKRDRVKQRD